MHLALNGEIITQAPALRGAAINVVPPDEGSWKTTATVICTILGGIYKVGTAPQNTPIGNLSRSIYDYVISETLGVHVDYNSTLGQQLEELKKQHPGVTKLTPEKMDSLAEKCEVAIINMHRPIIHSETATSAMITCTDDRVARRVGPPLTRETFEYVTFSERSDLPIQVSGRVSSYNLNTFKGRIFVDDYQRPIPFELATSARDSRSVEYITGSLAANARNRDSGNITCIAFQEFSRTGRLKKFYIVGVEG
jgi:hypothetical protein